MPEYRLTGPNGEEYTLTVPEGTPESVVQDMMPKIAPQAPTAESDGGFGGALSQFAAGASRGALSTLDVIPQAIGSLGNIAGWLATGESPELSLRPFSGVGRFLGLGTRKPETELEKTTGFAGEMVGATAVPAGLAMRSAAVAAPAAQAPQAALRQGAVEAASLGGAIGGGIAGEELIGGEAGRLIGAVAGGMVPAAAPFAAGTLIGPGRQAQMRRNLAAAQRLDVPMSAGQAAGGSFIEKGSALLPGGMSLAEQLAERQARDMGQRVREIAGPMAREASPEAAGRAVRYGLEEFTNEFRARGNQLYESVHALIPPQTPLTLNRTRSTLEKLKIDEEEFSKILDPALVRNLDEALAGKQFVQYSTAHALRSNIGDRLSGSDLIADAPKGQLKALYGALSQDLDDAAAAIGPQAEAASKRSSNYWRSGLKRIDDFLNPIQRSKTPEKVYAAAIAGTKDGASRIRALKRSLKPEQWDVVVGTVLKRLGRTVPSARTGGELLEETTDFSPQTFLTNLEQLDPAARKVLFSGSRYEALERGMQDLQTVGNAIRAQRMIAYNPSGTAGAWLNAIGVGLPTLGALANLPGARNVAMGLGANMAFQRMLQSPGAVAWMANPTAFQPSLATQLARPYEYLQPY